MNLSYPKIPPPASELNPKPMQKKVREDVQMTKIVFKSTAEFLIIRMDPVSFIKKPT